MTVARPEIGELVKTVVELVDAVNAGGGGEPDWANIVEPDISLTGTNSFLAQSERSSIALSDNAIDVGAQGDDGGYINLYCGGVGINLSQDPNEIDIVNGNLDGVVTVRSTGINGLINIAAATITALANEEASLSVDGGSGIYATSADHTVLIASPVADAVVDIQANGSGGTISISASGDGGSIDILATSSTGAVSITGGSCSLSAFDPDGNGAEVIGPFVNITADTDIDISSGASFGIIRLTSTGGDGKLGFFNTNPIVKPTGVAVDVAAIHAALVSLGLIAGP